MGYHRADIEKQLYELRQLTNCDFAALALYNKKNNHIQWRFVSGNNNERYKLMLIKPGQGVAGWVLRHGRNLIIDETKASSKQKRLESPIMLAEGLYSSVSVPVQDIFDTPAVLLIGDRGPRIYNEEILLQMGQSITNLGRLLKKDNIV